MDTDPGNVQELRLKCDICDTEFETYIVDVGQYCPKKGCFGRIRELSPEEYNPEPEIDDAEPVRSARLTCADGVDRTIALAPRRDK